MNAEMQIVESVRGKAVWGSRIRAAAAESGRSVDRITVIGASKGRSVATLAAAHAAGLRHLGENYVQDALPKMSALAQLAAGTTGDDIVWHFIGALQANKTRPVAENFSWVHTVDRLRIAERLSEQRPYHAPALNVCVHEKPTVEPSGFVMRHCTG